VPDKVLLLRCVRIFANAKFSTDLFNIASKKGKLSEGDADDDHRKGPDDRYEQNIYDRPEPVLLNGQNVHDLFGHITRGTTANGKGAKDQRQLPAIYFPFFL